MKADQIMDALSQVNEEYILESAPGKSKRKTTHIRWIAAVIALVALLTFLQTPPGVTALGIVKETFTNFIETLFPPKNISVIVEGDTEVTRQEAGGQEPDKQADGANTPGFAIYYDPEHYTMTHENGVTYIRFNMENELPPCEMEIKHIPHTSAESVTKEVRTEMSEQWDSVSDVCRLDTREGLVFHYSAGKNWDSACGDVYFLGDGDDGCFQLTTRYFVEASEGHGARFDQMIKTFEVIHP